MVFVGIDVAKNKHDCFICNSQGVVLADVFTIDNTKTGFDFLLSKIRSCSEMGEKIKVGLEATGHYSYNLLGFLLDNDFCPFVINPLHTNLYRKSLSLRKTKTDRIDAKAIASLLMSDVSLKPYNQALYHNEELKSLSRYRFGKVKERSKLKASVSRLVNILFPELEHLVSTIHTASVYALLLEFPSAKDVSTAHLTRLTNILYSASYGRHNRDTAIHIRDVARDSVGTYFPAKALELRHTLKLIKILDEEVDEIELEIKRIMDKINSPICSIPGISIITAAMIISEIGDFSNFSSPDKILAFAGLSPSTYQSGQLSNAYSHMEKRGSKYLRYAIFNATQHVCVWVPDFSNYLEKKRAEGKHYYVAVSHASRKLIRVMYALENKKESFKR